jgi:catechol 2,3-dioxygenase-like lactoylglutathione lyase family enzyme
MPCCAERDDRVAGSCVLLERPLFRHVAAFFRRRPAAATKRQPERYPGLVIRAAHTILYVRDPVASKAFYASVLGRAPSLDVPGMTEFELVPGAVLGLMPEAGITRLLGGSIDPARNAAPGRAEIYLVVDGASAFHDRALAAGARELSPLRDRDWGHRVAYSLDLDGHVLAFAEPIE